MPEACSIAPASFSACASWHQHNAGALLRLRYISSDAMATLIDCEVQSMLHEGRATAYTVLSEHYDQLTKLAHTLMEHEQLDRAQFEAVLQE